MTMNILLLGSTGQVGFELHRTLSPLGVITAPGREALDLGSEQAVASYLAMVQPGLIVNAAAYTAVDAAEDNSRPLLKVAPTILFPYQLGLQRPRPNSSVPPTPG